MKSEEDDEAGDQEDVENSEFESDRPSLSSSSSSSSSPQSSS